MYFSLDHAFSIKLWSLMTLLMQIWFMRIFPRLKKAKEPKTGWVYVSKTRIYSSIKSYVRRIIG